MTTSMLPSTYGCHIDVCSTHTSRASVAPSRCMFALQYFPFSLIDAMGPLDDCRRQIQRELRYQVTTSPVTRIAMASALLCIRSVAALPPAEQPQK